MKFEIHNLIFKSIDVNAYSLPPIKLSPALKKIFSRQDNFYFTGASIGANQVLSLPEAPRSISAEKFLKSLSFRRCAVRRRWLLVLSFLLVSLCLAQASSATGGSLRVNESITRFLLEDSVTKVSLAVENPSSNKIKARIRLELIDPRGQVRASNEVDENLKSGQSATVISLPLNLSAMTDAERGEMFWYRMTYRVMPAGAERARFSPAEGVVSLSEITPDMFELHVATAGRVLEGSTLRAQVRATHPTSLKPMKGVSVEGEIDFDDDGHEPALKAKGVTDAEGYVALDFNLPRRINGDSPQMKITGRRGLFVREASDNVNLNNQANVFVSTDKPIYQPGQILHIRALLFDPSRHALADEAATLKISDPESNTIFHAPLKTSRFGVASVDWPIPENTRLGDYNIEVVLEDDRFDGSRGYKSVKISRYDLPNFTVNVKPDRPYYLPEQSAEVEVRADYLFGQPVKRGHVRVVRESERHWNYREQKWDTEEGAKYEGETDAEGRFIAHVQLQDEHKRLSGNDYERYEDLSYAAYFTDPTTNRTEQRRFELRVTKSAIHVYISQGYSAQREDFPLEFFVTTFYADGTPAPSEVVISESPAQYLQPTVPVQQERTLRTVKTNRYGVAKVSDLMLPELPVERSYRAKLNFAARDSRGASGNHTEDFYFNSREVVRVETDRSIYHDGDPVKVSITGSDPSMRLIVDVSHGGGDIIRSQAVQLHDGHASLVIPYSNQFRDELTISAYDFSGENNSYNMSYGLHTVIYPHNRDLKLDVHLEHESYRPGEEAHADFNVSSSDGRRAESALGVVVFDRAVEERARTDEEFGGQYGFYGIYQFLRGDTSQFAGITRGDLERIDLSKPLPDEIDTISEVLLNSGYSYNTPRLFGSSEQNANQAQLFRKLIEPQINSVAQALSTHYQQTGEYPTDESKLKNILASRAIYFDQARDPWGDSFRPRWSIERNDDVLELYSAGADKLFDTNDDFTVLTQRWPYFKPTGLLIDAAVQNYHTRTGGYIRDEATLAAEMTRSNIDIKKLRDRWGKPYHFDFKIMGTNYSVVVTSGGPNGKFDGSTEPYDDFDIWTSLVDYFAEARAKIDAALVGYADSAHKFPNDDNELRQALARAGIGAEILRDPWGRNLYASFNLSERYADRVEIETRSTYGQTPTEHTTLTPVTQKINFIYLQSAGEDGAVGTSDDFNVAEFARIFTEQTGQQQQSQQPHVQTILSGSTGAIAGTVFDPNNAVIPGAEVNATNLNDSSLVYTTTTGDDGRYILRNVIAGLYRVRFVVGSFSPFEVTQVPVNSSNITRLDANLSVGAVMETVTVVGGAGVQVNTTSQELSSVVNRTQVLELAVLSRNPNNFSAEYGQAGRGAVNGQRAIGANLQLDNAISTPRLREHFSETLVWQPSLETDASGHAELQFKLADNITTWKMSVIGSTEDGEIGIAEREIRAFQPFFVEHDPPRVLTEGDQIALPVVTRNYLNRAQSVGLEIKPESWFEMLGPMRQQAEVAPGESARSIFEFRATASVSEGRQRITAIGSDASDAIERAVTVHPDGEEQSVTSGQMLGDTTTFEINIPVETIGNSARGEVKIYPNLMTHVAESIEGILQRPYGCGEQTISSTYPSLLLLRAAKHTGHAPALTGKAHRYLQAGYDRLLNYRGADGGFSYWGHNEEADLALTAYALRFLTDATEFIAVDEDVIKSARDWVIKHQREDGSWLAHSYSSSEDQRQSALLTAFIARVLAQTERRSEAEGANRNQQQSATANLKRALQYLAGRVTEIDEPYLLASYALASLDAGDAARAAQAITKLRQLAHTEGSASYWALETNTPFYGWGLAGRIETTALVVQALARSNEAETSGANDALINRGLLFLLKRKDRYGCWYSTQATINVLDALVSLLGRREAGAEGEAANGSNSAEIFVNNQRVTTLSLPQLGEIADPVTFDLSQYLTTGVNRVEIRRAPNSLPASAQVVATYYVPWAGSANSGARQQSPGQLRLSIGFDRTEAKISDEITCRVEAERVDHAGYGMLLAEIGLPPGAEVDRESLEQAMKNSNWGIYRYDVLPDRVVAYLWPQGGGTRFSFKFRPRFGLTAQSAPSTVYDYYNPEARVVLAPTRFVVR